MNPAEQGLQVEVVNDRLVISIGVSVLAYALQNGTEPFGAQIRDEAGFAEDVARQLEDTPNEGRSPLQRLLDEAGASAVEWGSPHAILDGDPQPSVCPPERS